MPVDHSIYQQIQAPDLLGNFLSGAKAANDEKDSVAQREQMKAITGLKYREMDLAEQQAGLAEWMKMTEMDKYLMQKRAQKAERFARISVGVDTPQKAANAIKIAKAEGIEIPPDLENGPFDKGLWEQWANTGFSIADRIKAQQNAIKNMMEMEKIKIQKGNLGVRQTQLNEQIKSGALGMSPAEKAADAAYGKEFVQFTAKNRANTVRGIEKLKEIKAELEKDTGFFQSGGGRFKSLLPDAARSETTIRRRDKAVSVANQTLKELFGGQLSDGERKASALEFWNDKLSNEEQAKWLESKINDLESSLNAKDSQANYYMKNKTIRNYNPNLSAPKEPTKQAPPAGRKKGSEIEWE